ncbi:MAG: hypothetical protein M3680_06370, partial [Myxococcota bacterium]|nr:hypothetical protein [Myxococcota bacterium]
FPDDLVLGALRLRRHQRAPEILHATWRGSPAKAAIGPALPEAALTGVNLAAGTLPLPSLGWRAQLVAASASGVMRLVEHQQASPASLQVLVVGAAVGYPLGWHMPGSPGIGVHLTDGEPPVIPDAVEALGCVLTGRWEVMPRDLAPHVIAELVEHLAIEDRLADAARLCDGATDDPLVRAVRGTVHALAGDLDRAIASYESANAFAPLAEVLISRGEVERALAIAVAAAVDMPEDALALDATVRALWHLGKLDEARAILDETPVRTRRLEALYALLECTPGPAKLVFPTLADRAHRRADRSGSQVLRARAHELEAG